MPVSVLLACRVLNLAAHTWPYAHDHERLADLASAIDALKPTVLIGVSGQPTAFTRAAIEKMAAINQRPVIFALSNPTAHSECTAEEAYTWSGGFANSTPVGRFAVLYVGVRIFRGARMCVWARKQSRPRPNSTSR